MGDEFLQVELLGPRAFSHCDGSFCVAIYRSGTTYRPSSDDEKSCPSNHPQYTLLPDLSCFDDPKDENWNPTGRALKMKSGPDPPSHPTYPENSNSSRFPKTAFKLLTTAHQVSGESALALFSVSSQTSQPLPASWTGHALSHSVAFACAGFAPRSTLATALPTASSEFRGSNPNGTPPPSSSLRLPPSLPASSSSSTYDQQQ